jgi:osmotically-inducible protein OsmY
MSRSFHALVVVIAVLAVAAGCQSVTGKTAGTVVDDSSITASVKAKLVADKPANLTRVDVDTNNGTVYLNGVVDTPEQRARAEDLARHTKGVAMVVNNLQVAPRR